MLTQPLDIQACFWFSATPWARTEGKCSFWARKSAAQEWPEGISGVAFGYMSTSTAWDSQSKFQEAGRVSVVCLKAYVGFARCNSAQQLAQQMRSWRSWWSWSEVSVFRMYSGSPPPPWHFLPAQLASNFSTMTRNDNGNEAGRSCEPNFPRRESGDTNRSMSPFCILAMLPAGTVFEDEPGMGCIGFPSSPPISFWITMGLLLKFSTKRISLLLSNHKRRCSREIQLNSSFLSSRKRWMSGWCLPRSSTSSLPETTWMQSVEILSALLFLLSWPSNGLIACNQQDKDVLRGLAWPNDLRLRISTSVFMESNEPPQLQIFNVMRPGIADCFQGSFEDKCNRNSTLPSAESSMWLKCRSKFPTLPKRLPPHVDCMLNFFSSSLDRRTLASRATSVLCSVAAVFKTSQFSHCSPSNSDSVLHASIKRQGNSGSSPMRCKSDASSNKGEDARTAAADAVAFLSRAFLALNCRWSLTISAWVFKALRSWCRRASSFAGASFTRKRSSWRWPCKIFLSARTLSSSSATPLLRPALKQHGIPYAPAIPWCPVN